jgi:hypothetical protein
MRPKPFTYKCTKCDKTHEGLPDVAFDAPIYYDGLPESERNERVWKDSDFCQVDTDYFIRGVLEIPIIGHKETFAYGVWTSVSEKNFRRYQKIFKVERPAAERYVGWISNRIAGYPDTLKVKAAAHVRPRGLRPTIEVEPTDHPLAVAQRDGLTMDQVIDIVSEVLHKQ